MVAILDAVTQGVCAGGAIVKNLAKAAYSSGEGRIIDVIPPNVLETKPVLHAANFVSQGFIEPAVQGIKSGGLIRTIGSIFTRNFSWDKLTTAFSKTGGRGMILLGVLGAATILIGKAGASAWSDLKTLELTRRGIPTDMADDPTFWYVRTGFKGSMLAGAIMTIFPPTTLMGIGLMATGLLGSVGCWAYRRLAYGINFINYPGTSLIPGMPELGRAIGGGDTRF